MTIVDEIPEEPARYNRGSYKKLDRSIPILRLEFLEGIEKGPMPTDFKKKKKKKIFQLRVQQE